MTQLLFIIFCLAGAATAAGPPATSIDDTVMSALNLRTGYNSAARPPPDNGTANVVYVFIYLTSLVDVDSSTQEMILLLWIDLQWFDPRLAWLGKFNASLDSARRILVPSNLVWLPDVFFYNILKWRRVSSENGFVLINNTGLVTHTYQLWLKAKCKMQLMSFPYDSQRCSVATLSTVAAPDILQVRVNTYRTTKTTSYMSRSGEFCVNSAELEQKDDVNADPDPVVFTVTFTRLPVFYVVNLILPSILLVAISTLSFCLPPECEERVAFSITIVLSLCVFLQLTGDFTPKQSETVPFITIYYTMTIVMTMTNVFGNVFVLRCHFQQHRGNHVNNRIIRALFLNRLVTGRWRVGDHGGAVAATRIPESGKGSTRDADSSASQADSAGSSSTAAPDPNEWHLVTAAADKCFFTFFFAATVGIVLALIIIQATTSHANCLHGSDP